MSYCMYKDKIYFEDFIFQLYILVVGTLWEEFEG